MKLISCDLFIWKLESIKANQNEFFHSTVNHHSLITITFQFQCKLLASKWNKRNLIRLEFPLLPFLLSIKMDIDCNRVLYIYWFAFVPHFRASLNNPPSIKRSVRVVKIHFIAEGGNSALLRNKREKRKNKSSFIRWVSFNWTIDLWWWFELESTLWKWIRSLKSQTCPLVPVKFIF